MSQANDDAGSVTGVAWRAVGGIDRTMFVAGVVQVLATFAPAANIRLSRDLSFFELPGAGVALTVLGALTVLVAIRPRGPWRWAPALLSALVLAVAYWRLQWAPTTSFVDPLLRRAVGPAWGFIPMSTAVLLSLVGAARVRRWGQGGSNSGKFNAG